MAQGNNLADRAAKAAAAGHKRGNTGNDKENTDTLTEIPHIASFSYTELTGLSDL